MKTKEQKRKEAQERQKEYDDLSLTQKIQRTLSRRGESLKERTRLEAIADKRKQRKEDRRKNEDKYNV